jgi:type 2A phosphatase activator TIP41
MLEKQTDLSPLTDANWVSRAMTMINSRLPPSERDRGCEKGREGGKSWPGLGKRIEVMRLPVAVDSHEGLSRGLASMNV